MFVESRTGGDEEQERGWNWKELDARQMMCCETLLWHSLVIMCFSPWSSAFHGAAWGKGKSKTREKPADERRWLINWPHMASQGRKDARKWSSLWFPRKRRTYEHCVLLSMCQNGRKINEACFRISKRARFLQQQRIMNFTYMYRGKIKTQRKEEFRFSTEKWSFHLVNEFCVSLCNDSSTNGKGC